MLVQPSPARYLGRVSEIFHTSLSRTGQSASNIPQLEDFLVHARFPGESVSTVLAYMLTQALKSGKNPLIRGLPEAAFQGLIQNFFPGIRLQNSPANQNLPAAEDEYDDLVTLLMQHRHYQTLASEWLCHAIASASLYDNHLWQDMGLPNRNILSQLMQENFPSLAAKNSADMKWKKFFYRQLCEQAEVLVCKSPKCTDCCDYTQCFEMEAA